MPTTPFMLLSAACFIRSSERAHDLLVNNKIFGKHIKDYYETRIVSRKVKVRAIVLLWISIIISGIMINKLYIIISLFIIAFITSYHILKLKSEK